MEYLHVQDPALHKAMTEFAAIHADTPYALPFALAGAEEKNLAPATVMDILENHARVQSDGHEIERYVLPLKLPAVMADLVWFFTQRTERANREIPLGAYVLHPHEFRLSVGGQSVSLTGREVAMLQFMARAGECTKESLLLDVWRYHPDTDTHTVETHLWRLRQKLQTAGMTSPLILTTDKGYRIA